MSGDRLRDMNYSVGNQIILKRKEKRLSQEQLAEKLDMSIRSLSRYENGERTLNLHQTTVLAKALGTSVLAFIPKDFMSPQDIIISDMNLRELKKLTSEDLETMLDFVSILRRIILF